MDRKRPTSAGSAARRVTGPTSAAAGEAVDGDHLALRSAADATIRRNGGMSAVTIGAHEKRMTVTVQGHHQGEATTTESATPSADIAVAVPAPGPKVDTTDAHANSERVSASTAERKATSVSTAPAPEVVPATAMTAAAKTHASAESASATAGQSIIGHARRVAAAHTTAGRRLHPTIAPTGDPKVPATGNASTRRDRAAAAAAVCRATVSAPEERAASVASGPTVQGPHVADRRQQQTAGPNVAQTVLSERSPPQQEGTNK